MESMNGPEKFSGLIFCKQLPSTHAPGNTVQYCNFLPFVKKRKKRNPALAAAEGFC